MNTSLLWGLLAFTLALTFANEDSQGPQTVQGPEASASGAQQPQRPLVPEEIPAYDVSLNCSSELMPGQYLCPYLDIDSETQQPRGCRQETERAPRECHAIPGIICLESGNRTFWDEVYLSRIIALLIDYLISL